MQTLINHTDAEMKMITPDDGYHYFFAYYDMRATGKNGQNPRHLCHRVTFFDRLPTAEDVAEIGYLEDGKFVKIAETTAWNFQQGAMLQYHPYLDNTVYYNVCENGKFMTVTHNFVTGEKQYTDRATACVSPDGKWGLAVNFGRIFAFRPGYGYAAFVDENESVNAPEDDGVFLVDMETGKSELILSYARMAGVSGLADDAKILVNHITFSPDCNRFVMLTRDFPIYVDGKPKWHTSLMVGDRQGNMHTLIPAGYASHYFWTDDEHLLIHCGIEGQNGLYLINVISGEWKRYDAPYLDGDSFVRDIHCSLSPDGNYIIGDSYPYEGYRHVVAYSLKTGEIRTLASALNHRDILNDCRCDLHARFVWGGSAITFDSIHDRRREIVCISTDCLNF